MIGRKWSWCFVLCALMAGVAGPGLAQQSEFPFDGELILDVRPMPGSKRIPNMDIAAKGKHRPSRCGAIASTARSWWLATPSR